MPKKLSIHETQKGRKPMFGIRGSGRAICAMLAGAAAMALAGQPAVAQQKIRVGYSVIPIHLQPLVFKKEFGIAKYEGTKFTSEMIHFRGSSAQLTALAAGELDLAVLAFSTFAAGIVNARQDIVALADVARDGPQFSSVFAVLQDSPIKTVGDLKGKVLAINAKGGAVDMAARTVLLKAGLKPGVDVNIVEARFGAMESMVRQKKTDVAVFVAPFWARAQVKGGLRPLFYQRDGLGTTQFLLFAAKKDWVAKNRAVLVDWMEDYVRGVKWLLDPANRTKATGYAAAYSKRKPGQLSWAFQKESDYYHDPEGKLDVPAFQSNVDLLHKLGVLRRTFDVGKYVDHSVVEEAAARLKK
jgi:sulfonate transport system substrate-binding protein